MCNIHLRADGQKLIVVKRPSAYICTGIGKSRAGAHLVNLCDSEHQFIGAEFATRHDSEIPDETMDRRSSTLSDLVIQEVGFCLRKVMIWGYKSIASSKAGLVPA